MAQSAANQASVHGAGDSQSPAPLSFAPGENHEPVAGEGGSQSVSTAAAPAKLSFRKRVELATASMLGTTIIRSLTCTYRYRIFYKDHVFKGRGIPDQLEAFRGPDRGPLLFAVWHGSCFPLLGFWRDRGMCVVTSRSTDGQALARILHQLGFQTVSGSSSRGGTRALIDLTRVVKGGGDAAIAVDGPRGPAMVVKPGIVLLAKLTGRPIVPLAATSGRCWQFQSWDRFRMPLPFTRAVIIGDDPIYVPPDADHELLESKRKELEQRLCGLQQEVDSRVQPSVWKRADRVRAKGDKVMTKAMGK